MYFSNFPKLVYDFDLGVGTDYRVVTDITRNVRIRKFVLENISLFDYYDVAEGETPEIISEKVYGTPYYHWVIMLVNQRYDYITDFPLSQQELDAYIRKKYTEAKMYSINCYKKNGVITEGVNVIKLVNSNSLPGGGSSASYAVGDIVQNQLGYLGRIDQIISTAQDTGTYKVSLRDGAFNPGDIVSGVYETLNGIVSTMTIPQEYTTLSNYDYEFQLNESKRRIKIVDPRLIDQVIKEFEDIL